MFSIHEELGNNISVCTQSNKALVSIVTMLQLRLSAEDHMTCQQYGF